MFWTIIYILGIQYFMVECMIPSLSVNKIDRKLVSKQRQDTLDMCRMFSEGKGKAENGRGMHTIKTPYHAKEQTSRRGKRSASYKSPGGELADARRVESIVDKLYEDLEENGEKVQYRKRNLDPPIAANVEVPYNKSGRRYPFAPTILLGPETADVDHDPDTGLKTVEVPWHKKWINGIVPFFIDPSTYDSQLSQKITKAFDYFERATCIRLQRLKDRPTDKKSLKEVEWLYITNPLGIRQCVHSNSIKVNKGVQMVVFGYDCLTQGEIVHEVMHILGFSHEHTRPDRDEHITVLWNNIKPGYKHYFDIKSIGTLTNLPYDYSSILHYPPRAFSRNGQYTLLADKNEGAKLGQRKGLSELDVEKVTMIYGNECVDRNQKYLLQTCPSVVKPPTPKQTASKTQIEEYFKDRIWPYGVITFKIRDDVEFSAEEIENIKAVIRHIQKETCIEFNDASEESDEIEDSSETEKENKNNKSTKNTKSTTTTTEASTTDASTADASSTNSSTTTAAREKLKGDVNDSHESDNKNDDVNNEISQKSGESALKNEDNKAKPEQLRAKGNSQTYRKSGQSRPNRQKRVRRSAKNYRRHAENMLILTRGLESGCKCPKPGKTEGHTEIQINADCFNSVNDLLHLFVHILGLDHQHNMHDRDEYLKIVWENLTPDVKQELRNKLPPAASVGFPYDYLSVMHYPWLQIKDGVANIMYPVWNDGWAMGHWQGLSSIDVQKLNLLYFQQCVQRKSLEKKEHNTTGHPHKLKGENDKDDKKNY
ncbi:uncharacterized protein LOC128679227 [Plodia interpunctella]|uniref:uncharacterized protein LOC128679227 n=1 Tax=Plodia interpunctella TaxID=58824 RepID=UPI0023674C99|nr:uncharacterized protein LOC128679227 [Plodia interpunctella]